MRERLLLDRNWRFALGHASDGSRDFDFVRDRSLVKAGEARGAAGFSFDDSGWRIVNLPHDWCIELPLVQKDEREHVEHGCFAIGPDFPENSVGWYRRTFDIPKRDLGRRISVEFDGAFRDSIVWINGHRLGRHTSGYTPFRYDLTDFLNYGAKNVLAARVDASCYEGWWYEGAGIYRHVWLLKTSPVHVAPYGVFVASKVVGRQANVTVRTNIVNDSDRPVTVELRSTIRGVGVSPARSAVRAGETPTPQKKVKLVAWSETEVTQRIRIKHPRLWSCDQPDLYQLRTTLTRGTKTLDTCDTTFGIRTLRWDARRGFFLNGKRLKIKGMCNHRDHAGVGAALPDRLHELRIEKLKELGCNAFRASHYPHAPEVLDACDRLGILVMAENRLAGSSPEVLEQLRTLILRDRNHASVILWSLANEEHTVQWSIAGERIGRAMVRLCHTLDPTRKVTTAMHDKGLGVGFANVVDVHGWNYIKVGNIEAYHRKHPERPIIGSEEASTVCTRGIYADDPVRGYVRAYDERAPKWGSTAEDWWKFFAARDWLAGAFVWTGFDYRGEPIPYKWPCTASHFGVMDLCGFPKDNYYYYKSWWSDHTVLHLFPHWNWLGREGEEIDVRCFTNCDEVELILNSRSLGRQAVEENSHAAWKVKYDPGILKALAFREGQLCSETQVETTDEPKQIVLTPDRDVIRADGEDVSCITISVVDSHSRAVPTADNPIDLEISGAGRLIGVGNGDPSSHESDRASARKLFNGLALAIVQADRKPGDINVAARSPGLAPAQLTLRAKKSPLRPFIE
jgi:beta-galactosidase